MKKICCLLIMMLLVTGCGTTGIEKELSDRFIHLNNFICDKAKEEGIMFLGEDYLVLNNGDLYDYVTNSDKLYSNNKMCKKADVDFKVERVAGEDLINKKLFYTKDNTLYVTYRGDRGNEKYYTKADDMYFNAINENEIVKLWDYSRGSDKIETNGWLYVFYTLKNDGSIYEQIYDYVTDDDTLERKYILELETLYLSSEKYGKILDFNPHNNMLITEDGLYSNTIVNKAECEKYEDIECEYKIEKNQKYEQYKDEIEFLGIEYSLLKNGTIISTNFFVDEE